MQKGKRKFFFNQGGKGNNRGLIIEELFKFPGRILGVNLFKIFPEEYFYKNVLFVIRYSEENHGIA